MPTATKYAGIYLDFDTGKNTFFGVNVGDLLDKIASKSVGKLLLDAIGGRPAPNNPVYTVLIKPMGQAGENAMYTDARFTRSQLANPSASDLARNLSQPWGGLKMGGGVGSGAQPDDWSGATNGVGTSSTLKWNSSQSVFQNEVLIPHFILLAHELVHCPHNLLGANKGEKKITVGSEQIKHEEAYCVGLGPYTDEAICENSIRAQWDGVPRRDTYGTG
jgi:hypothetical protein